MTLSPLDVAAHWPFIERNLNLLQWPTAHYGLATVAGLHLQSGGESIELGQKRLQGAGLTGGEARAVLRSMEELRARGVLLRFQDSGRRPSRWSIRPGLTKWRAMPWVSGAEPVERAITFCACRAAPAVVAQGPGQRGALSRSQPKFWLSEADHLLRPGLLPVDVRDNGGSRATTASARAWEPVDVRDNGDEPGLSLLSSRNELRNVGDGRTLKINEVIRRLDPKGIGAYGRELRRLDALAVTLTDEQVDYICQELPGRGTYVPPRNVNNVFELATEARGALRDRVAEVSDEENRKLDFSAWGVGGG